MNALWAKIETDLLWMTPTTHADHLVPTWWFLNATFDDHHLANHGLTMPPYPNAASTQTTAPALDDGASLPAGMPPTIRLHVLYIQHVGKVSRQHLQDAIVAICKWVPQTEQQLATLLSRRPATIKKALQKLTQLGALAATGTPAQYS